MPAPDDSHPLLTEHLHRAGFLGPRSPADPLLWAWADDATDPDRVVNVAGGPEAWAVLAFDGRDGGEWCVRQRIGTVGELREVFRLIGIDPRW